MRQTFPACSARGERPRDCAAEQRDELAALHFEHGDFLPDAVSARRLTRPADFQHLSLP